MLSPATRFWYMNGPTQIGLVANLSPSLLSCVGDMIIPARSANCAVNGEYGDFRWMVTLFAPFATMLSIGEISLARADPLSVRSRWMLVTTAAALNGVPSLNLIPFRKGIVIVSLSLESVGRADASCGTICAFAF